MAIHLKRGKRVLPRGLARWLLRATTDVPVTGFRISRGVLSAGLGRCRRCLVSCQEVVEYIVADLSSRRLPTSCKFQAQTAKLRPCKFSSVSSLHTR